jgi:hypothetical protein
MVSFRRRKTSNDGDDSDNLPVETVEVYASELPITTYPGGRKHERRFVYHGEGEDQGLTFDDDKSSPNYKTTSLVGVPHHSKRHHIYTLKSNGSIKLSDRVVFVAEQENLEQKHVSSL